MQWPRLSVGADAVPVVQTVCRVARLLYFGHQIYQEKPPIPERVSTASGQTVYTRAQIETGQNVWQSMGGMQQGSIWGHGSYVAPDWSADWLNREANALLEVLARAGGNGAYADLPAPEQARLQALARQEMRANTFDPATGAITVSDARAEAMAAVETHVMDLFGGRTAPSRALRKQYAMPMEAVLPEEESRAVSVFFFWTAWAATTVRPGETYTYTHNWPYEPLIGNRPTGENVVWTGVSIIMLLAGISAMAWWYAARRAEEPEHQAVRGQGCLGLRSARRPVRPCG